MRLHKHSLAVRVKMQHLPSKIVENQLYFSVSIEAFRIANIIVPNTQVAELFNIYL